MRDTSKYRDPLRKGTYEEVSRVLAAPGVTDEELKEKHLFQTFRDEPGLLGAVVQVTRPRLFRNAISETAFSQHNERVISLNSIVTDGVLDGLFCS